MAQAKRANKATKVLTCYEDILEAEVMKDAASRKRKADTDLDLGQVNRKCVPVRFLTSSLTRRFRKGCVYDFRA